MKLAYLNSHAMFVLHLHLAPKAPNTMPPRQLVFNAEETMLTTLAKARGFLHRKQDAIDALQRISHFLSARQRLDILNVILSQSSPSIERTITQLQHRIATMHTTSQQEGLGSDAVVHLHYTLKNNHWLIIERDELGHGNLQTFGLTLFSRDTLGAEVGYINIEEITNVGARLCLEHTPTKLGSIIKQLKASTRFDQTRHF